MTRNSATEGAQIDELAALFEAARPTYEALTNNLAQLIATLIKSKGVEYIALEPRTKTVASFRDKVERPTKQGKYDCIEAVTDLSGIRVITYYQKDVSAICELIEQNFAVDTANSTDKTASLDPDRFGYLSVHYIISHNKERQSLTENSAFSGMKAEIQVRTVLQHAWAVLDRKLRYNNEEDIPREVRRKLFRVSALLESADENFSEIDRIVTALRSRYTKDIRVGNLNQEVNLDSLEVFMREAPAVKALVAEAAKHYKIMSVDRAGLAEPQTLSSVSNLVMAAQVGEIKSIEQLNDVVVAFSKVAKEKLTELAKSSPNDTFTTAGIIRLALVYMSSSEISFRLLVSVPFYGALNRVLFKMLHPDKARGLTLAAFARIAQAVADRRSPLTRESLGRMLAVVPEDEQIAELPEIKDLSLAATETSRPRGSQGKPSRTRKGGGKSKAGATPAGRRVD